MDTMMLNMRNLFEQLVRRVEILSEGNELRKSFWAGLWEEKKMRFQIWTFYIAEVYSNPKIVFHFESPKKNSGHLFVVKASWTRILNVHFFFLCIYF